MSPASYISRILGAAAALPEAPSSTESADLVAASSSVLSNVRLSRPSSALPRSPGALARPPGVSAKPSDALPSGRGESLCASQALPPGDPAPAASAAWTLPLPVEPLLPDPLPPFASSADPSPAPGPSGSSSPRATSCMSARAAPMAICSTVSRPNAFPEEAPGEPPFARLCEEAAGSSVHDMWPIASVTGAYPYCSERPSIRVRSEAKWACASRWADSSRMTDVSRVGLPEYSCEAPVGWGWVRSTTAGSPALMGTAASSATTASSLCQSEYARESRSARDGPPTSSAEAGCASANKSGSFISRDLRAMKERFPERSARSETDGRFSSASAASGDGAADSAAGAALSFLRLRLKKGLTHPRYRYCNRNSAYRADRP